VARTKTPLLLANGRVMTCDGPPADPLGIIDHGYVVIEGGRIASLGAHRPSGMAPLPVIDLGGRLLTPGLIDCHTHLPFLGDRAAEFALRARGAGYQEIAAAGGGIASTVAATRAGTSTELINRITSRARRLQSLGITTVECKSGYDLTVEGEARVLECIAAARRELAIELVPTLLAHVVPAEHRDAPAARRGWVEDFAQRLIPRVAAAGTATSVDVYCDQGAFTLEETRTILTAAASAGLGVRAHVGQFADLGGAALLAELGGWSADHLEQISEADIAALVAADIIAVMIPTACVQLRQAPPPVERLRQRRVKMAVASDWNPGTSWVEGLGVPMWLATTHYGMTVEEAWLGVTRHAAAALRRSDLGVLRVGARADFVLWDAEHPAAIPYRVGSPLIAEVWCAGKRLAATTGA
jgi:imidazolonepropionase